MNIRPLNLHVQPYDFVIFFLSCFVDKMYNLFWEFFISSVRREPGWVHNASCSSSILGLSLSFSGRTFSTFQPPPSFPIFAAKHFFSEEMEDKTPGITSKLLVSLSETFIWINPKISQNFPMGYSSASLAVQNGTIFVLNGAEVTFQGRTKAVFFLLAGEFNLCWCLFPGW